MEVVGGGWGELTTWRASDERRVVVVRWRHWGMRGHREG